MKHLSNAVLVVISLAVVLIAIEMGLRYHFLGRVILPDPGPAIFTPHPTRSFEFRPGIEGYFRQMDAIVPFRINKAGFRGREIDEPKKRFRILVIGDSAVAGSAVGQDDLFTILLEQELGAERFEVINGGTPAYNAVQLMIGLQEWVPELKPDLVIFAIAPVNDIQGSARDLRALFKRKFKRAVGFIDQEGALQIDHSASTRYYEKNRHKTEADLRRPYYTQLVLYQMISGVVKRFTRAGLSDPNILLGWPFLSSFSSEYSTRGLSNDDYQRLWTDGWAVMQKILLESRKDTERHGARFAITAMPAKLQVIQAMQDAYLQQYPNLQLDPQQVNREIEQFARQQGIAYIDLLNPMLKAHKAGEKDLYPVIDHHLAKAGHAVLARALAEQLKASKLIEAY